MANNFTNRRWIFLTSGDVATKVNFNEVLETSPETCRYNVAPPEESGKKSFVKYEIMSYPQDDYSEITLYSGFQQESPTGEATWDKQYNVPLGGVESGTYDTYYYDYEITGSGARPEWEYLTDLDGHITGKVVVGTAYYPLYADNILSSGLVAPSGAITGRPLCYEYALDVDFSGEMKKEFKQSEMLAILTGDEWRATDGPQGIG